jgi:hypothetical protein
MTTDITIALAQAAEYLKASGQTEKALAAGRHSPGFCLPNQDGAKTSSASILRRGPLLLIFYSGGWCPGCDLSLRALEEVRPLIEHVELRWSPARRRQLRASTVIINLPWGVVVSAHASPSDLHPASALPIWSTTCRRSSVDRASRSSLEITTVSPGTSRLISFSSSRRCFTPETFSL